MAGCAGVSCTGTVGALGRNLMLDIAGVAASSGGTAAVRGVTHLLFDVMEDLANPYSILAQDLLSEKMRCGDDAPVREIAERTSPDREFAFSSQTDGTTADRYGLHDQPDLDTVVARGAQVELADRAVARDETFRRAIRSPKR